MLYISLIQNYKHYFIANIIFDFFIQPKVFLLFFFQRINRKLWKICGGGTAMDGAGLMKGN